MKSKQTIILFVISMTVSLMSFSQDKDWIDEVQWKNFENFKKNKKNQISLIYIEGDRELQNPDLKNNEDVLKLLEDFNCTKLNFNQDKNYVFKGKEYKKNEISGRHSFLDFLIGNDETVKLYPHIVILDKELNFINFNLKSPSNDDKKTQKVLIESEEVKLRYLKDNLKDKNSREIEKQERRIKFLKENMNKKGPTKSIFNLMRYKRQMDLLLNYFKNEKYNDFSFYDYIIEYK